MAALWAKVATVSLKPVAWCWCSPDEEVPRRHPAVRKVQSDPLVWGCVWGVPPCPLPASAARARSPCLTPGVVNPVYSQQQDGQGAA